MFPTRAFQRESIKIFNSVIHEEWTGAETIYEALKNAYDLGKADGEAEANIKSPDYQTIAVLS